MGIGGCIGCALVCEQFYYIGFMYICCGVPRCRGVYIEIVNVSAQFRIYCLVGSFIFVFEKYILSIFSYQKLSRLHSTALSNLRQFELFLLSVDASLTSRYI